MGEAFGEGCREEARELYEIRMRWAILAAAERGDRQFAPELILEIARQCLEPTQAFDPDGYEEFCGIGRGAGLTPEQVYVLNGLTDLQDALAFGPEADLLGCSSCIIAPDRAADGQLLVAQNWDLKSDNMAYVRLVHRRPAQAPATVSLTLTGCLSLIGLNREGLAIGNTNLLMLDARIGVQYLSVIHKALGCATLAAGAAVVREAPRAGGHYYYLAAAAGAAIGLECSARQCVATEVKSGVYVHCNHALAASLQELDFMNTSGGAELRPNTHQRQDRLQFLLDLETGPISVARLKEILSDHCGDHCLCRHDSNDISTNACVIISPGTGELHACRGQPHVGEWVTRRV